MMLRGIGSLMIALGAAGCLREWEKGIRRRIRELQILRLFFQRAGEAIGKEQKAVMVFFTEYEREDMAPEILCDFLNEMTAELSQNIYPSGYTVWEKVLGAHRKDWNLTQEQWQYFVESGQNFFGRDRRRMAVRIEECGKEMERFADREKRTLAEKKKVFYPVGMLGALMLAVLLF